MMLTRVIPCLLLLLTFCTCNPVDFSNSNNPVPLAHMCMRVNTQNNDNQVVLLLHGLTGSKEIWQSLYEVLAFKTGKRICAADLRNHGNSPWSNDTSIESMASDIDALLKSLGDEKVILLGHSLGGKVAMHFTLNNPDKVDKLIVEDMRPNGVPEEALKLVLFSVNLLISSIDVIPKGTREKEAKEIVMKYLVEAFKEKNLTFPIPETHADRLPLKCTEDECNWQMNVKVLVKILQEPEIYMPESSGLFENPALFLYGADSPFKVGENEEEILKLFPKAKLVSVEGAGHTVHETHKFKNEVIKFINEKD